jgi:hypothetical protein
MLRAFRAAKTGQARFARVSLGGGQRVSGFGRRSRRRPKAAPSLRRVSDFRHGRCGLPQLRSGGVPIAAMRGVEHDGLMPSHETPNLFANDRPYRATYRCVRLGCGLTTRLLHPVHHCPRCGAQMAVTEQPERDVEDFVAAATADVVAGFDELLRAA